MVCLVVLILFYGTAIIGPIIAGMVGIDPYKFDPSSISDTGRQAHRRLGRHHRGAPAGC